MKHKIISNKFFQLFLILLLVFLTSSSFFYKKTSLHPDDHEYLFFTKIFSETSSLFFYNELATSQKNSSINNVGKSTINDGVYFNIPMRFYGTPIILGFLSKIIGYEFIQRFIIPLTAVLVLLIFYLIDDKKIKKVILLLTSPFFLFMTANIDSTFLGILFYLSSLFFIKKKDSFSYLISGFLLGLSFMVRPNILFLFTVNFYFLVKNFLEDRNLKSIVLFISSSSVVLVYMMYMNSTLYGNFYTLGYWYSKSSDLNNLSSALNNIKGEFSFFIENIKLIPKLLYYSSPILFLLPFFIKKNKKNLIYFLLLLPYFLYIISKPFNGYGSAFNFESTISSPIRYLSPFFMVLIFLLELKKNGINKKLFFIGIVFNLHVSLFQPMLSLPAVFYEKNVFGYDVRKLVEDELSRDDILISDYFLKWSNFNEFNIIDLTKKSDISQIKKLSEEREIYILPISYFEKEFYLNNESNFQLVKEKRIKHYRGQKDLMTNKVFKLYKFKE